MGLDWRTLDLSDYLEALEAHNEAHSSEKPAHQASDGLKRFMQAHRDGGNTTAARGVAK
ncbi:MAG: hypothetical protein ACK4ZW_08590 [Blastomonas sp.]